MVTWISLLHGSIGYQFTQKHYPLAAKTGNKQLSSFLQPPVTLRVYFQHLYLTKSRACKGVIRQLVEQAARISTREKPPGQLIFEGSFYRPAWLTIWAGS